MREDGAMGPSDSSFWDLRFIWSAFIPPRIKVFLWQFARGILPTRNNLLPRHVQVDPTCPMCAAAVETVDHLFFRCVWSSRIWLSTPFASLVTDDSSTSPYQWLLSVRNRLTEKLFSQLASLCSSLWWARNQLIFDNSQVADFDIIQRAYHSVRIRNEARIDNIPENARELGEWTPPTRGIVRVNFDGALPKDKDFWQVGVVARDCDGSCLWWETYRKVGRPSAADTEAMGALMAVRLACKCGWYKVEIEGDCQVVIDALNSREECWASFGGIIQECQELSQQFHSISFRFCRRFCNKLANALAKSSFGPWTSGSQLPSLLTGIC